MAELSNLLAGIRRADIRSVARACRLIDERDERTPELLKDLFSHEGHAYVIGVTGTPGAGKSTLVDGLIRLYRDQDKRVAVLAIDPTSSVSGGSILGDKTRMGALSVDPNAFIRPSPTSGTLGGVAKKTRESMIICEAAGHDVILVETVGVGQSETAVASMVDFFLVLMLAGATPRR